MMLLGDYNRYIIEYVADLSLIIGQSSHTVLAKILALIQEESEQKCSHFYDLGHLSAMNLEPHNYFRLGLILNRGVFLANIKKDPIAAIEQITNDVDLSNSDN